MAESHDPTKLHPPLKKWVSMYLSEDFKEAVCLTKTESKNDPPEEPFRSLYSARKLLLSALAKMDGCTEHFNEHEDFKVVRSCLQLELGINYINAEELSQGEELLETCLTRLNSLSSKVKTASITTQALNQLGILWGNRDEQQKALECLLKSKAVYESHIALPPPITDSQWLLGEAKSEAEREKAFESNHTLTLFYLAQVYGNLGQAKLSAQYCQTTLCRQLEMGEYDGMEWSLNCAILSQFYMTAGNFAQARHCLAAAGYILQRFRAEELGSPTSEATGEEGPLEGRMGEQVRQTEADISRCWTKYCISLLTSSREHLDCMQKGEVPEKPRHKVIKFDSLDLTELESAVSCNLVENYEEAKPVFLACQKHINTSKLHYTLENFASEHVVVNQDHSNAYKLLASFETASELKCRMHKRRIDMLTALQRELNPQYYLSEHRQIMHEVAEAQSLMADLKIVAASDNPTPHAVSKINKLLQAAARTFEQFVASFHAPDTGALPDSIDQDYLRPILCSKLNIASLLSKIITPNPAEQVGSLQWLGGLLYVQNRPFGIKDTLGVSGPLSLVRRLFELSEAPLYLEGLVPKCMYSGSLFLCREVVLSLGDTVKPPNNGHVWDPVCREVVHTRRFVLCWEVFCPLSECPLSEVSLY